MSDAGTGRPIRVIVVDDDSIVRDALVAYANASDLEVLGAFSDGAQAVAAVDTLPVEVVMMDVRMPVMDGITAARHIRANHPRVKVLLLTSFDEDEYMVTALSSGASGFLLKDASPKAMVDAVRAVHEGTVVVSPEPLARLVRRQAASLASMDSRPPAHLILSARELEILTLLCQALSNSEISNRLFLSESTVKTHVSTLMSKLMVKSRLKAVLRAYEWGLVERQD